jgi:hypothetical protein
MPLRVSSIRGSKFMGLEVGIENKWKAPIRCAAVTSKALDERDK